MTPTLAVLQRNFSRYVLHEDAATMHAHVQESDRASAAVRLDVYAQGYRLRLLEVIGNDHPGTRALLGAPDFERLARDYIEATPSRHFNVRWYAGDLVRFITASEWAKRPGLAAMAELEWRMTLAFDAIDAPVVVVEDLAAAAPDTWPGMRFTLHPSLQRMTLHDNVNALRSACDRDETPPTLTQYAPPAAWIAWRHARDVRHRLLELDECAALDAIDAGATFAEVCERLCEWHAPEDVAMRAASLLQRWVHDDWISTLDAGAG